MENAEHDDLAARIWHFWRDSPAGLISGWSETSWQELQGRDDDQSRAYVLSFRMMAETMAAKADVARDMSAARQSG